MNRRDMLLATTGALASAAAGSAFAKAGGVPVPPIGGSIGTSSGACALILVQPAPRMALGLRELCLKHFFPNQVAGSSEIEQLSLDLQLLDDRSQLQTIYAWQLARRSSASWSGGFRMRLTDQAVNLVVNLRKRGSRTTESWSGRISSGGESILATPRASTGRAPLAADLRLDPSKPQLWLADGSPRDFDALLLSAI